MLKVVNKLSLGPKLFIAAKDFVVYEFVPGNYFENVLNKANKSLKKILFRQLFEQAFILDRARLSKEEMSRPLRNAIVTGKNNVVLIDFERAHKTKKPHNVTQLCSFAAKQLKLASSWQQTSALYKQKLSRQKFCVLLKKMGL